MTLSKTADVAVIGAGIAGLRCARSLVEAGKKVIVLEKARGVGGRVATRRLHGTCADHGTCYLSPKAESFQRFLYDLAEVGVLRVWTEQIHTVDADGNLAAVPRAEHYPRWVAPAGMTAIAKVLAADLDIYLAHQVTEIALRDEGWHLTATVREGDSLLTTELLAKALVIAVPAPQAANLIKPIQRYLPASLAQQVNDAVFFPCLSVMAGYSFNQQKEWVSHFPGVKSVTFTDNPVLGWLGFDSSKRVDSKVPVFVLQSSAAFAQQHLESVELQPAAQTLLEVASQHFFPWFSQPTWFQIHRWRYAFSKNPYSTGFLADSTHLPLVFAGDWCLGRKVDDAYQSGLAAAAHLLTQG
ncbi:MAG TPA: FAD-dependent oxidoreductase [Leptolyngbyaceae cyanobacterium M33_DOE_097]|uniref:FAD-dependent oxidoreductase n=1 Tax=Oscillatoriales cyanobacterium SpSt-418 TaxID=2282169 RepID=A0A7C3KG70_9CYAN|nr:FAD-dependent oxidoreductase [Leptolyngbyaceae cyanobacterium M33_DOE_097]